MSSDAGAVLDRLRLVVNVSNDTELHKALKIKSKSTVSSWRARNSIPYAICVQIAADNAVCLDWLLTGQGEMYKGSEKQDMKIVKMAELMEGLDAAQRQEILSAIAEKQQLNKMKHQLKQLTTDWQKCKSA